MSPDIAESTDDDDDDDDDDDYDDDDDCYTIVRNRLQINREGICNNQNSRHISLKHDTRKQKQKNKDENFSTHLTLPTVNFFAFLANE